jgi:hypothetical protein
MSQSDLNINNVSRSLFRAENNEALQALASLSSGATEPATMYAYMWWADTTAGILKMRNAANTAWINKGSLSAVDSGYIPAAGGTFTGDVTMAGASIFEAEGTAVASAATTDIWTAGDGNTVHVTGSTGPITSLGTAPQAGAWMKVIFDGTPTLTQGANLNLNAGGVNITIEAGDMAFVYADTTTQLDVFVIRKSGSSINSNLTGTTTSDNAAAGKVGEYIESDIVLGSAISLTSNVAANITSISLTPGDWDVSAIGRIHSNNASTSFTNGLASISTVSATLNPADGVAVSTPALVVGNGVNYCALGVPSARISISVTTTVYLVARSAFTVSTAQAYGKISARRAR